MPIDYLNSIQENRQSLFVSISKSIEDYFKVIKTIYANTFILDFCR